MIIAESGKKKGSPRVSTTFSLGVKNEQADTGWVSQTCLAIPNSDARTGAGNTHFPCSADHEKDWQSYAVGA